jgi:hypothetical protein
MVPDVFLLGCNPWAFEKYTGFTLTCSKDGKVFKISSKEDYSAMVSKAKGVPIHGNIEYTVEIKGGYLKPVLVAFKAL